MEIIIISLSAQVLIRVSIAPIKLFSLTSKPRTITDHPEKPFGAQYTAEQQTTQIAF